MNESSVGRNKAATAAVSGYAPGAGNAPLSLRLFRPTSTILIFTATYVVMLLALLLSAVPAFATGRHTTIATSEFGTVEVAAPEETTKGFVLLFSGEDGIDQEDRKTIDRLLTVGIAVAAIDTQAALKNLNAGDPKTCIDLSGPLEWVSHNAQHDLKLPRYYEPVLLGRGNGAALVYVALVQAPPLSFAGGSSVDFVPRLPLQRPLCTVTTIPGEAGYQTFAAGQTLRGIWQVAGTVPLPPEVLAFAAAAAKANGREAGTSPRVAPPGDLYVETVQKLILEVTPTDKATVSDLPLVEVASTSTSDTLAIIYSGDGGWRDIDKTLGDMLKKEGIAVVGVDVLRYFWSKRTPEEVATDLGEIMRYYLSAWKLNHVVLIGYSFGADILPFAYNRLPEELRRNVVMLSLLAPSRTAIFEIEIFEWLGAESDDGLPLEPEVRKIEPGKLQCFYGEEEAEESLCTLDLMRQAEIIKRPGSHHFDENYQPIAAAIVAALKRRLAAGEK
ncbi:MAG: AcvB/VirJ family lysyl-phosphatidylglycerol hydrolase [Candidatus Competibacteraceae bacterium]